MNENETEESSTSNWRDTLFTWKGKINRLENNLAWWTGRWVGMDGLDTLDESLVDFENSINNFEVLFSAAKETFDFILQEGGGEQSSECKLGELITLGRKVKPPGESKNRAAKGWKMEKKFYKDAEHTIKVCKRTGSNVLVVAKGDNNFGQFVAAGVIRQENKDIQLILSRRYITEDDVRVKWNLDELEKEVGPWDGSLPWQCRGISPSSLQLLSECHKKSRI